ncbi:MAG: DUF192 domain-containing protein [Flavobacteriaceae bacterium]|nr:DUF192 domain-containing protein [Flavobacteriaceae bacterium]
MSKTNSCLIIAFCLILIACGNKEQSVAPVKEIEFRHDVNLSITSENDSLISGLKTEIADDDYQRETGLMYRKKMNENQAMLFVFENEASRGFYMKNTLLSLDIIFIDTEKRIVNIHKHAQPLSEKTLYSEAPAQYVLEVKAGLSEAWGLAPGNKVSWN